MTILKKAYINGNGKNYITQIIVIKYLFILLFSCKTIQNVGDNSVCNFDNKIEQHYFILDTTLFKGRKMSYSSKTIEENNKMQLKGRKNRFFNLIYLDKQTKIKTWYYYDTLDLKLRQVTYGYELNNFLEIGKEKYFDKKGEVTKVIDYRQKEKYPICYKQALMLVDKWKPKNYEINSIERDSIIYKKGTTYTWMVHVRHPIKPRNEAKTYLYTIDAKTGKKLKKVETRMGTNDDL